MKYCRCQTSLWQIKPPGVIVPLFSVCHSTSQKTQQRLIRISSNHWVLHFPVTAENNLIFILLKKRRCISSSYSVWESAPLPFSQISSYDFASELWKEWAWGSRSKKTWRFPTESQSLLECIWLQCLRRIFAVSEGASIQQSPGTHSGCCEAVSSHFCPSICPAHRPPGKQLWDAVSFPRNKSLCLTRKGWRVFSVCAWGTIVSRGAVVHSKRRMNSFQRRSLSLQRSSDNWHPFGILPKKIPVCRK